MASLLKVLRMPTTFRVKSEFLYQTPLYCPLFLGSYLTTHLMYPIFPHLTHLEVPQGSTLPRTILPLPVPIPLLGKALLLYSSSSSLGRILTGPLRIYFIFLGIILWPAHSTPHSQAELVASPPYSHSSYACPQCKQHITSFCTCLLIYLFLLPQV